MRDIQEIFLNTERIIVPLTLYLLRSCLMVRLNSFGSQ